jgi:predicted amidohydrolase YtcJ
MSLALVGAAVRTLDPDRPSATAVFARDGVIAAVGSDAEIRESCDARTEVIDLHGAAVGPRLPPPHTPP